MSHRNTNANHDEPRGSIGKVIIVTPFENRMAKRGTRLPRLAELLVQGGFDVEYVTTNFSHAYKRHFSESEIQERRGIEPYELTVIPIPAYTKNMSARRIWCNIVMSIRCFKYLWRKTNRNDVVLVPSRPVSLILSMAILKLFRKVRLVMDIRDVWPDALAGKSGLKMKMFSAYCNTCLYPSVRHFDAFTHISPSFVDWLHRYAPKANSKFIPPGFDRSRWERCSEKTKPPGSPITVAFVGLLQHQLDVMPMLESLLTRPEVKLYIVGDDGTGERYPEVIQFVDENKLENVEMVGRLSPEAVVEFLSGIDIGLIPMISNSIPNKVFDCIAAYLPMIVLGNEDCASFVREHDIGWSCQFDAKELGELIDELTPAHVFEKSKNVAAIRNQFARDLLFRDFIDIIESRHEEH